MIHEYISLTNADTPFSSETLSRHHIYTWSCPSGYSCSLRLPVIAKRLRTPSVGIWVGILPWDHRCQHHKDCSLILWISRHPVNVFSVFLLLESTTLGTKSHHETWVGFISSCLTVTLPRLSPTTEIHIMPRNTDIRPSCSFSTNGRKKHHLSILCRRRIQCCVRRSWSD